LLDYYFLSHKQAIIIQCTLFVLLCFVSTYAQLLCIPMLAIFWHSPTPQVQFIFKLLFLFSEQKLKHGDTLVLTEHILDIIIIMRIITQASWKRDKLRMPQFFVSGTLVPLINFSGIVLQISFPATYTPFLNKILWQTYKCWFRGMCYRLWWSNISESIFQSKKL